MLNVFTNVIELFLCLLNAYKIVNLACNHSDQFKHLKNYLILSYTPQSCYVLLNFTAYVRIDLFIHIGADLSTQYLKKKFTKIL